MPITPTYPGVYVQEIPSGVHTITGVATSITGFVGQAKSGPVNEATEVLSFADYERNFGGLASFSTMSYAVQQFFLNGGSDAWIVRIISASVGTDTTTIRGSTSAGGPKKPVLQFNALSAGQSDRTTAVFIDQDTSANPPTAFTLAVVSLANSQSTDQPNAPKDIIVEKYTGLSMTSSDPNYILTKVNGTSKLVVVQDLAKDGTMPDSTKPNHGSLTGGTISNITTLPHAAVPASGSTPASQPSTAFRITLDGTSPYTITPVPANNASTFASIDDAAAAITSAVQALKKGDPAFDNFACTVAVDASGNKLNQLDLTSGSYGSNSSVKVQKLNGDTLAADLQLVSGTTSTSASNRWVLTGSQPEQPVTPAEEFDLFIGSRAKFEGIYAFDKVDLVNLICLPGVFDPSILSFVDAYCQERRAFMIVDPQSGQSPNDMYTKMVGPGPGQSAYYASLKTDHGAIYYPWIEYPDALNNGALRTCPPSGMMAGLYARTDTNRGVWKAPAGTEATLTGVQALEYALNNNENGILNPQGVNCLRFFPAYGFVSWGARTLRGSNDAASEYKYVPVRRTALFLEESLYRGLQWVVFEPNDEPLWAQIRLNVGAFMHDLFRKGAFQGSTPKDAYFVKCDNETTTQDDIDKGIVNIVVGFAPLKPAEFVIIQIQQVSPQLQV